MRVSYQNILDKEPLDLIKWLEEEFVVNIPENLDSVEQMIWAESLLSKFGSQIVYLDYLLSYAKVTLREARRNKLGKEEIEHYIDKKENIERALEGVKALQSAVSRMVTTRQEINKELNIPTVYRK